MFVTYSKIDYEVPSLMDLYNHVEHTRTHRFVTFKSEDFNKYTTETLETWRRLLHKLAERAIELEGENSLYYSFFIPKRSGGMRKIDAPLPDLKEFQSKVAKVLSDELKILPHNSAYAYVKGRNPLGAMQMHKEKESRWFLKLDFSNFFGTCTEEFIYNRLSELYPLATLLESTETQEALKKIIHLACLNGVLPQGSPLSPLLCNLVMVDFDYNFSAYCEHNHLTYTRYADDMCISSEKKFETERVIAKVRCLLAGTPLKLNPEKTRFGSYAGRNWNLGLMYNKDLNITVGHQRKKLLQAGINNIFRDFTKSVQWDKIDVQVLFGQISYISSIEEDYVKSVINKYENKYEVTLDTIKEYYFKL